MKRGLLVPALILVLTVPASGLRFSLRFSTNSLAAGGRAAFTVRVLNGDATVAADYSGWIRLRSTDPALRIRGDNADGTDVDFYGTGIILLDGGTNRFNYAYSFNSGNFSVTAEEYMRNSEPAVSPATADFSVAPARGGILFSEIMFRTEPDGFHYIELYNASALTVSLLNLSVFSFATGTTGSTSGQLLAFIGSPVSLEPGCYYVISQDKTRLLDIFPVPAGGIGDHYSAPPGDSGHELILSSNGTNMDAVEFGSSDTYDNVSLERRSFTARSAWLPSLSPSARSVSFRGTPGAANSVSVNPGLARAGIRLSSGRGVCIPGETTAIDFSSETPGRVSVVLLDISGRPVRDLFSESDIGRGIGYVIDFDGMSAAGNLLPVGPYVVSLRFINDSLGLSLRKNILIVVGWKK